MQMLNIIVKGFFRFHSVVAIPVCVKRCNVLVYADRAQQAFGGKNATWSLTIHKDYCGRRSDVQFCNFDREDVVSLK
jgi:hypothetical protein